MAKKIAFKASSMVSGGAGGGYSGASSANHTATPAFTGSGGSDGSDALGRSFAWDSGQTTNTGDWKSASSEISSATSLSGDQWKQATDNLKT